MGSVTDKDYSSEGDTLMSEPIINIQKLAEPFHITLTKNTKGYQWEVSVHSETGEQALEQVQKLEAELKAKYGGETS